MNRRLLVTMLLLAAAAACSDVTGPGASRSDLFFAQQRWAAQDLHNYQFTLQRMCFCGNTDPLRILVIHDTVANVADLTTGESLALNYGMTVTDLFGVIRSAQRAGTPIEAEYHPQRGYPTHIIDNGPGMALDAGAVYTASDVIGGILLVGAR